MPGVTSHTYLIPHSHVQSKNDMLPHKACQRQPGYLTRTHVTHILWGKTQGGLWGPRVPPEQEEVSDGLVPPRKKKTAALWQPVPCGIIVLAYLRVPTFKKLHLHSHAGRSPTFTDMNCIKFPPPSCGFRQVSKECSSALARDSHLEV